MKRGSALVMALWTIAVLSLMAITFAYEARQQSGINLYVQRRYQTERLIDSGKVIAEMLLCTYPQAEAWTEDQDEAEMLEKDAWFREKQDLKETGQVAVGPVVLDPENPEAGIVSIDISASNSGDEGIININEFYDGAEGSTEQVMTERWWMIFKAHNIPEELDTPRDGSINLWNILIASWKDWRDEDGTVTTIDGRECGAEDEWYEELEEKYKKNLDDAEVDELRRRPRNGPIPDVRELEYVRGFRDYPQVLTGGVINPWADEKEQIEVEGIMRLFCTEGSAKINVNNCGSETALMTIPGVYARQDIDRDDVAEETREIAKAIVTALRTEPVDSTGARAVRGTWPFKDFDDMLKRLDEVPGSTVRSTDIDAEARNYLEFSAGQDTIFKLKITAWCSGMSKTVNAQCYVKDNKVRYVRWSE